MKFALLFFLTVALCSMTALAAEDDESGIYNVRENSVTISEIAEEQFNVVVSDASASEQYLILVRLEDDSATFTEENIYYIDQKAGSDSGVTFEVYPRTMVNGNYSVWLTSSTQGITTDPAASFSYKALYTPGEVDGMEGITARDALFTLQYFVGTRELNAEQLLAAEVDGMEGITARDALFILQASLGTRELGN